MRSKNRRRFEKKSVKNRQKRKDRYFLHFSQSNKKKFPIYENVVDFPRFSQSDQDIRNLPRFSKFTKVSKNSCVFPNPAKITEISRDSFESHQNVRNFPRFSGIPQDIGWTLERSIQFIINHLNN